MESRASASLRYDPSLARPVRVIGDPGTSADRGARDVATGGVQRGVSGKDRLKPGLQREAERKQMFSTAASSSGVPACLCLDRCQACE